MEDTIRKPIKERGVVAVPLYPTETEIAVLVLGVKRARDWSGIAKHLERTSDFPPIDALMGGRFWPAVEAYFRQRQKSVRQPPLHANAGFPRIKAIPVKQNHGEKT